MSTTHTCPTCGGSGKKTIQFRIFLGGGKWDHSTTEVKCPYCRGTGELTSEQFHSALYDPDVIDATDWSEQDFCSWYASPVV